MKNKIKLLGAYLITIIATIALGITIVNAETVAKNLTIKSTDYKNPPMSFPQTFHVKKTSGDKYVYCATYAKKTPSSGIKYTKDNLITDNGTNYILKEAYKNVDSNKDFFIYQTALWIYMSDKGLMDKSYSVTTFKNKVNNSNSTTAKKIKNIISSAKKAGKNDTSTPTINLSASNVTFSLDSNKEYYVSSKIKLTSSTTKYTVTFTDAPSGTTYKVKSGYLYVYVPVSKVANLKTTFKINVSNSKTVYTAYNYKPSNNKYQKMYAVYKDTKTAKDSLSLTINRTVDLPVTKVDSATGAYVSGAKLQVTNSSGKVIASWTTNGSAYTIKGLTQGTYTLTETQAPNGYNLNGVSVKFTIDGQGVIKNSTGSVITSITFKNTKVLKVLKVDNTTGKALSGAKLQITNSSGKVVESWTSTTSEYSVKNLTKGTYTLSEVEAPSGYILNSTSIKFTIDEYGNVKDTNGNNIVKLEMKNQENSVTISKQDITNNQELPGATLTLKNSKGKEVLTWVSTNTSRVIKGLPAGTYTLTETIAPKGYVISKETITFTIDKYGKLTDKNGNNIDKVIMYNTPEKQIDIEISKQDITTSKELPGASLTVTDNKNNIIDTWVSSDKPHSIKDIKAGTYTLKETVAPDGYILSEETITFTVDKDGNLTDKDGNKIDKVIMYNKPKEEKSVTISKQDITDCKELPGAHLNIKDESGKELYSWVSTDKPYEIKDIKAGTYTLTETIAPAGYVLSTETIEFTIDNSGQITDKDGNKIDKVIMFNKPIPKTDVEISKQDITTSKELPGASLVVKDKNGNTVDSWISTEEVHTIKNMTEGEYTLTETIAPVGYILSTETITFKIDENGKLVNTEGEGIERVIMYNEKEKVTPKVPVVKIDEKTNKNLAGATLEVKDTEGKIWDNWISTEEAHYIELPEGTYTLTEISAPKGYVLNNTPITFNVNSEGKITDVDGNELNTIIMENTPEEIITKVSISKQDITNSQELPGAHLVVKDKDGNVIDSWISTNEPHLITGLTPGEYTLNEVVAPDGYVLSDETITFTVKEDGSLTNVVMYNKPEETAAPVPTPGVEIEVENTGTFKNMTSTIVGGMTVLLGTLTIFKKKKEN